LRRWCTTPTTVERVFAVERLAKLQGAQRNEAHDLFAILAALELIDVARSIS
jgi:hypothetical protein